MANHKTGREFPCKGGCGRMVYRAAYHQERNLKHVCGYPECRKKMRSGKNNPFYGQKHTEETRRKMREQKALNPSKGTGPPKGYKHTADARRKISQASKRMWKEQREKMLASLPRGVFNPSYKGPDGRTHRTRFSRWHRREWLDDQCAYCGGAEYLELDHIVPVFDGGTEIRENTQTLCKPCNMWKLWFVDVPRYKAILALQQG